MASTKKGISLYFLIGIVVAAGAYLFVALRSNADKIIKPRLEKGVLDATDWCLKREGLLTLDGEWEIYYNRLLEPEDFAGQTSVDSYFTLPGEMIQGDRIDGVTFQGYATLRGVIRLKSAKPGALYGIRTLYLASSSKIYVNGKAVASEGIVSADPEIYQAQYAPMEAFFSAQTQDVEIVIQIANFHHRRVRLGEIWFGTKQGILQNTHRGVIGDSLATGCLLVISLCFFFLHFLNRRKPTSLWLAFIAFFVAMRGSIVGERILIRMLPNFSPEWMMKLGYLPAFILLPLFVLYFRYLFDAAKLDRLSKILGVGMALSCLLILATDIKVYDLVFEYTQWIVAAIGLYIIYVLLANKLIVKTRGGMNVFAGGCAVLLAAVNDALRELGIVHTPEMLTLATVLFIAMQAIYLGWRLNNAFVWAEHLAMENERMVSEIQSMNALLENKVQLRTRELELANSELERLARV
ncbi:MAG TPA: 7TM-DISM domain-containing protein, partial [Clostridia bacterium]|nr:7TM-DISM domain-containing protein [Clostridia bacterium]